MRALLQSTTTVQPTPASTGHDQSGPATNWPPLLGIIAFVIVSSVVLGWIGWTKRHS